MIDTKPDNYYCIQYEKDFYNMLNNIKREMDRTGHRNHRA